MVVDDTPPEGAYFDSGVLDQRSYQLVMIYAFAEMMGSGVKRLVLSPALTEDQFELIIQEVQLIADEYHLVLHVDRDCARADVPHGDTTIGDKPFVMLDIFYPIREDFVEKCR